MHKSKAVVYCPNVDSLVLRVTSCRLEQASNTPSSEGLNISVTGFFRRILTLRK